jgi:succinate dehydrogenase (ubiquinone) membrane anchor subunit
MHGSWHWYFERVVAVTNASFLGAMIATNPNYIVDFGLTFSLPLHAYLGMGAIITDYLPQRKFPFIYRFVRTLLYAVTGLTVYGLYKFNTNDIGISALVKKIWSTGSGSSPVSNVSDD